MNNPFDHFEKIVCICGQHEPERWIKVQKEFERIGVLDRVERFDEVIDSNWLTETFGATSEWSKTDYCHWKIISDAHEGGLKNVFIFESDVHFIDIDLEKMSKSIESLEEVDWKLFYMGGIPHNVYGVHNESLINVSMCQAHAYAINGKYCKEVAERLMDGKIAIDQVYKREKQFGLARKAYATHPRFVVQADADIHTRKNFSTIMWRKSVEPLVDLHNQGIEFKTMSSLDMGMPNRQILKNFKKSLENVGLPAGSGYVEIYHMKFKTEYEKLELIHDTLKRGKICLYSDSDVVFLKNPMDYLLKELEDYDLIIQSNAEERSELKYFNKVVNPGFCIVKPTELTLKLFDTSESCEFLYEGCPRSDMKYINSKLNSSDVYRDNLKMKILDEDEFCVSDDFLGRITEIDPYMVHYRGPINQDIVAQNKIIRMKANGHWSFLSPQIVPLQKMNIDFVTATQKSLGKQHRLLTKNLISSLDDVGMYATGGALRIYDMQFNSDYEKLELIHDTLKRGKICFYTDSDIVFLKNPTDYLLKELEDYDLIIQSNADDTKIKLKKFKKVLHPGFCIVKPTELTLKLFDTSERYHFPGQEGEPDKEYLYRFQKDRMDMLYFNTRLNLTTEYFDNLRIKILDENEFCLSKNFNAENDVPYIVHYNENDRKVVHPKNKINRMRENDHWVIK